MAEQAATNETNQPESESRRERSKIDFPYLALDDAVEIAKTVHQLGGTSCQWDHLAAQLNQNADGGSFRLKVATARLFGFLQYSQGTITLTSLGARVCDPQQEKAARAEAFLNIPLYKSMYDQYKGTKLPPPAGLEGAMVTLGVPQKQKEKARQVFQRSASQAGFFPFGADRLAYPSLKGSSEPADSAEKTEEKRPEKKKKESDEVRHPFIEGLIKTLPQPEAEWPIEARKKWLQAASNIFDLIYTDSDSKSSLKIEVQKDSAK